MPLQIRPLEAGDFQRGFMETLSSLAPVDLTIEEALHLWRKRQSAGTYTIVAEVDGKIAGTASLLVEHKFIHRGGIVGHIEDVAVNTEFWRQGIGNKMVSYLTKMAKTMKCYKVILSCHDHLIPFYEKMGFKRHDSGMRINCVDIQPEE